MRTSAVTIRPLNQPGLICWLVFSLICCLTGNADAQGWQQSGSVARPAQTQQQSVLRWRKPSIAPSPHHIPTDDIYFDDDHVRAGNAPVNPRQVLSNSMRSMAHHDYVDGHVNQNHVGQNHVLQNRVNQSQAPVHRSSANLIDASRALVQPAAVPAPPAIHRQEQTASPVQQASWSDPGNAVVQTQFLAPPQQARPVANRSTKTRQLPSAAARPEYRKAERDFFSNPFGKSGDKPGAKNVTAPNAKDSLPTRAPATNLIQKPQQPPQQLPIQSNDPTNSLRGSGPGLSMPAPSLPKSAGACRSACRCSESI